MLWENLAGQKDLAEAQVSISFFFSSFLFYDFYLLFNSNNLNTGSNAQIKNLA